MDNHITLDRAKTAMIVVDMQNGFLDDEGSITKGAWI